MKQLLARLLLLCAFAAATVHAPAAAHADGADHHADHAAEAIHDGLIADPGDPAPANEGSADGVHHHHCPTVLDAFTKPIEFGTILGSTMLFTHREHNLSSFSQAPPTEPPSA